MISLYGAGTVTCPQQPTQLGQAVAAQQLWSCGAFGADGLSWHSVRSPGRRSERKGEELGLGLISVRDGLNDGNSGLESSGRSSDGSQLIGVDVSKEAL